MNIKISQFSFSSHWWKYATLGLYRSVPSFDGRCVHFVSTIPNQITNNYCIRRNSYKAPLYCPLTRTTMLQRHLVKSEGWAKLERIWEISAYVYWLVRTSYTLFVFVVVKRFFRTVSIVNDCGSYFLIQCSVVDHVNMRDSSNVRKLIKKFYYLRVCLSH